MHSRALATIPVFLGFLVPSFAQQAAFPGGSVMLQVTAVDGKNQVLSGAEVALGDEPVGVTDETGALYLPPRNIEPKTYVLSVGLLGFATQKQNITIPKDPALWPVRVRIQLASFVPKPPSNVSRPPANYRVYRLFYATDRRPSGSKDPLKYYANEPSVNGTTELGQMDVSIPFSHTPGAMEAANLAAAGVPSRS